MGCFYFSCRSWYEGMRRKEKPVPHLSKTSKYKTNQSKDDSRKYRFFLYLNLSFDPPPPVQSRRKKSDPCLVVVKTLFGTILLRAMHFFFSFSLLNETQIQSHQAGSPPPPLTIRAFIFIARSLEIFLPSSTRIEWRLPTLQGALSGWLL